MIINSGLLALGIAMPSSPPLSVTKSVIVIARHRSEQQSQSIVAALGGSVLDVALGSAGAPAVSRYLLTGAYRAGAQVAYYCLTPEPAKVKLTGSV